MTFDTSECLQLSEQPTLFSLSVSHKGRCSSYGIYYIVYYAMPIFSCQVVAVHPIHPSESWPPATSRCSPGRVDIVTGARSAR